MGEWKRIYGNPRRLIALGLITVISVVLFFVGRMEYFGPGSVSSLIEGERYYADMVSHLRGHTDEEIQELLEEEYALLDDYFKWRIWQEPEWMTMSEEELSAAVSGHEFLTSLEELDYDTAANRLVTAQLRLSELTEQSDYISTYASYLDQIQLQAQQQSQTAIFGDKNSFAHRNLVRTAEEFDVLRGVEVKFGANRAYEGWIEFELADYLYLLVIILFVLAFLEERRAGLWGVIRSCKGGRARLGLHRVLILASACALGVALIYGVNLLFSLTLSGGWGDTGRSVQSMLSFRTYTGHISIGAWIIEYLLIKAASGFMVGLFLWCILSSISNVQLSIAVLGVIIAVEYALFTFLPVQSIFNPVKYFNLFSYVRTSVLYTQYLNIDLFGYPFGIRRLALIWLPIFVAIFLVWILLIHHKRRPEGNRDILSSVVGVWDRAMDFLRRHFAVGGWEMYKTLIFQRGILILAVICIASGSLSYIRYPASDGADVWYNAYLEDMQGVIDDSTDEYLEKAHANALENPELLSAVDRVESYVTRQRERAEAGGYEPWIVSSSSITAYDSVYGEASVDVQRLNAAIAMMFLIVCCAAMWSYENQSGVVFMVRSLKRGRKGIFARKLVAAFVMASLVWAMVYIREFSVFRTHFPNAPIDVPVRNIDALVNFPFNVTMGQYILIVCLLRFIMLYMLAMVVMFISRHTPTVELSYMLCIVLLGLPALLFSLGIDILRFISPVVAVSSTEGLWSLSSSGGYWGLLPFAIWLIIGIAAILMNYRRWVR